MLIGTLYQDAFVNHPSQLFTLLQNSKEWESSMKSRKTMSYGKAYNYSQISYAPKTMIPELAVICDQLKELLGYRPNNCLLNFYLDGQSKMGYHSDQIDILENGTGISIISLGADRILKFKNKGDSTLTKEVELKNASLFHMNQDIQKEWLHSIPKMDTATPRISLTFRQLK